MNNSFFALILILSLFVACGTNPVNIKSQLVKREEAFSFSDKNGSFLVNIGNGLDKKGKVYYTKRSMKTLNNQKENMLEKSIALSDIGSIKNVGVLRPKKSQYTVWFDGKKYQSNMTIIPSKRSLELKMKSPEAQWSGSKTITFPKTKSLPCFFTQILECAEVSGFLSQSIKKESGSMNLLVVWEGYPYLNETFTDFPSEAFSPAELEYDGKTKESERRFNLKVAGQTIVFVVNEENKMTKMFWVTQGISMISKSVQNSTPSEEDPDFE